MSGTDNPEQFEVLKQQKEIIEQGIDLYDQLFPFPKFLQFPFDTRDTTACFVYGGGPKQVQQETKERDPVPSRARHAGYDAGGSRPVPAPGGAARLGIGPTFQFVFTAGLKRESALII